MRRFLLMLLLLLTACNFAPTEAPSPTDSSVEATITGTALAAVPTDAQPDAVTPPRASERVEQIIAGMSLTEKVGQMFMLGYYDASETLGIVDLVSQGSVGGIVLFAHNVGDPQHTAEVVDQLQAASLEGTGIPLLIAADQEGGIVTRLSEGFTPWPNAMAVAAAGNLADAEQMGLAMGEEMRAVGVNMDLAPVADVVTNPDNLVIGVRSFGSVPEVVAAFAEATVRGLHQAGIITTAKHFPGHGGTLEDSHESLPVDGRSREEIVRDMQPFAALVDAGVDVVMTAHVVYPALSDDGMAATFSRSIVTGILREEMGFDGVVITDALSMGAVLQDFSVAEAVERAVQAGADMMTFGRGVSPEDQLAAIQYIVTLVRAGEITESRIDESVRRILTLKERYGLLGWTPIDGGAISFDLDDHQVLSYEITADSITLLLDRTGQVSVNPAGSVTVVYPVDFFGVPNAFRTYDPDVNAIGISYNVSAADRQAVLAAADRGDTMIVLTVNTNRYPSQGDLVRALPAERTIAVAIRSPFDVLDYPNVNAYMLTYSGSDHALFSLARAIYGAGGIGSPGKLPVNIPGIAQNGFQSWTTDTATAAPSAATAQTRAALDPDQTAVHFAANTEAEFVQVNHSVYTGGDVYLRDADLGTGCDGYYSTAPTASIMLRSSGPTARLLIFAVGSSMLGTNLVVRDPQGNWFCGQDWPDTVTPTVEVLDAPNGEYDIWAGMGSQPQATTPGVERVVQLWFTNGQITPGNAP